MCYVAASVYFLPIFGVNSTGLIFAYALVSFGSLARIACRIPTESLPQ